MTYFWVKAGITGYEPKKLNGFVSEAKEDS